MSSQYTPITFPAWFQPSVTLAYQIALDAYSGRIGYGSYSLTANTPYTIATFNYTNKLQHTEFAFTIFGYLSVAENLTLNLVIDGTTYLTQSVSVGTSSQNIVYSGYFNLPTGSHSCSITLTVSTSATLTLPSGDWGSFAIGNAIAGVNTLSIKTLTGNEVYAVLVNYNIIHNSANVNTLNISSKNNVFNLYSANLDQLSTTPPINTTTSVYYPTNYILGDNDTTQTINIYVSGSPVAEFALIRRVVINEASVVLQNYPATLATGLS